MLQRVLQVMSMADWIALGVFLLGWMGYSHHADHTRRSAHGLRGVTYAHRLAWGRAMAQRENRITDAALIGNLMNSVSFYANTTIYIIAGLIAVAGTLDKLVSFTEELPFARTATREIIELKVFLLIGIFIYAYFKFTWSLRQFNFLSILLGATPPATAPPETLASHAERFGILNALSGDEFNDGIRAYYFGFAALGWFAHPALLVSATLGVILVLYRRDFHSRTFAALRE
jgi:uncharacterized membrane protein